MSTSETVARHREAFRRRWEDEPGEERAAGAWPEPETPQREARSDEVPPAARKVLEAAEANGWACSVVYSRGTTPVGASWAPGGLVEACSVRCRRGEVAAVGYWRAPVPSPPMKARWAWSFGMVVRRSDGLPRHVGCRELQALLAVDPSDDMP